MPNRRSIALLCLGMLAGGSAAHAAIVGPYDASIPNTKFLFHMDVPAGSSLSPGAVSGTQPLLSVVIDNTGAPPAYPSSTAFYGATGASGAGYNFGQAANLSPASSINAANGLVYDANGNGVISIDNNDNNIEADNITPASFVGSSGAFTIEALVNLQSLSGNQSIVSLDSGGNDNVNRAFLFQIESGTLKFYSHLAAGNPVKVTSAPIPTTGADAWQADTWYHVAYSYDGSGNGTGTGTLYWTKLDPSRTEADVLLTDTTEVDLSNRSANLAIGNENRVNGQQALDGLIDEVRISSVDRGPDDFMFSTAVPEPGSLSLLAGLALIGLRRRRCNRHANAA